VRDVGGVPGKSGKSSEKVCVRSAILEPPGIGLRANARLGTAVASTVPAPATSAARRLRRGTSTPGGSSVSIRARTVSSVPGAHMDAPPYRWGDLRSSNATSAPHPRAGIFLTRRGLVAAIGES